MKLHDLVKIKQKVKEEKPGFPCQHGLIDDHWWCSKSEYIYQRFHLQMQEGHSGGVTKQWP
jgi:hypothetical protein